MAELDKSERYKSADHDRANPGGLDGEYNTILFDLDGTLRYHEPSADQAVYD